MTYAGRLAICAATSVAGHLLLARGSANLPARVEAAPAVVLRVELRDPPAPEPEPEPQAAAPEKAEATRQPVHEARRARRVTSEPAQVNPPKQATPTERPATGDTGATPVFGISMESTSSASSGPSLPVGNTLQARPRTRPGESEPGAAKGLKAPVAAYEVTKMPLPKGGGPEGKYTEEAREAGLEGVVIFDLVVDEHGRTRDIKVVQGLGLGLTEAATRQVRRMEFWPGERNGTPVPVSLRGLKIRFQLRENE
jgi:TonB family protein